MKKYPCKDCKERYLGCSDKCEKYQQVKEENFQERKWVTIQNKEHMGISAAKYSKQYGRWIFPDKGINKRNRIKIRREEEKNEQTGDA